MEKSKYNEEDSIGSLSMHSDDDGTSSAPLLPHSSTIKTDESMTFITSLEGLRGVAIIAVLCSHLWPPFSHFSWNLGMMGVSVFFALSGYLITGILLKMQSGLSLVHLPLFFASRTIRLAPSLFICVFGTTVLWINQGRGFDNLKGHALTVLLYVENIYCKEQGHKDQILAQAWTLAVEEQFYIIWAVLLPVIASGKLFRRTIILGAIFTISIVYRMAMYRSGDSDMMSKSLLANSYALVAGSCLRLLPSPSWMHTPKAAYVGQILFVITVLCMRVDAWAYSGCIYGPFSAVIATLLTITGSVAGGNWILETSLLRHFGRISYTLYLWHHVFLWLIGSFNQVNIHSVGAICISYLIAETSTIYIEEPIRERFKSTQWFKMQKQKVARNHALDGGIVRS